MMATPTMYKRAIRLDEIALLIEDGSPATVYLGSETLVWGDGGMGVKREEVCPLGDSWCLIPTTTATRDFSALTAAPFLLCRLIP